MQICIQDRMWAQDIMDWDQLRYFLELSRSGKLVAAAARLGVNQTTISRRVQLLEKTLNTPLFTRVSGAYALTEAGRRLMPKAEMIETAFLDIEKMSGESMQLSGSVRIGATEGYGTQMLAPLLAQLTQRHPQLRIDLLAVPRIVNLSRREADIVLTLERPSRGPYLMTRLTDYALGLYAARSYLDHHPPIRSKDDLAGHPFISYIDELLFSKELSYLSDLCSPEQIVLRSTSVLAQQQAVLQGAGLAILPVFLARNEPQLVPILPQHRLIRTFWMLMPMEIKDIARMRLTWDFLRESASAMREALMTQNSAP
ncbi:LysR family transcriptional regulator [Eoetvoesiella caeni]